MIDWREIQKDCDIVRRVEAPDGTRALVILRREDGFFCFVQLRWLGPWDEGDGPLDDGYWSVEQSSGIFESQAAAEREASAVGLLNSPP